MSPLRSLLVLELHWRAVVGEALEQGTLKVPCAGLLTVAWRLATAHAICRKLRWPAHVRVVAVGGATLGGSGKTPLAIACAAKLADVGAPVVLVGHAHRAAPRFARVVTETDAVDEVGDEALMAVRALRGSSARVVVAPSRQAAIDFGARLGRVLVLDGVSQTSPVRASLALLSVDAVKPWGLPRALPPRGDLRAHPSELVDVCDVVVPVGDPSAYPATGWDRIPSTRDISPAHIVGRGAHGATGELFSWAALERAPVGLITSLAHPERVSRWLASRGVRPHILLRGADHGPLRSDVPQKAARAAREAGVALWLATPKCSVHVARVAGPRRRAAEGQALGAPLAILEYALALSPSLLARLEELAAP
jgi:tetraacyldisaccharide 4'-kinase